jgi:hypothetical protein
MRFLVYAMSCGTDYYSLNLDIEAVANSKKKVYKE